MFLRRYNSLNPRLVHRRLQSYYRNPSSEKRQKIEEMLQITIEAMGTVETAMSKSHQMIVSLFKEFLDYTDVKDATRPTVLEEITEEIAKEVELGESPLVDPETGELRFKILHKAFSKNRAVGIFISEDQPTAHSNDN